MEPELQSLTQSLIFFSIALLVRALFSFLETSISTLRLFKLKELAQRTPKRYKGLFLTLEKNPQRILITILIANSLADVITAALATHITQGFFSYLQISGDIGFSVGIIIGTIAIILFGEIIPKSIAKACSTDLLISTLWITNIAYLVLYPVVTLLLYVSQFIMYLFGTDKAEQAAIAEQVASESEIHFLIGYIREKGLMDHEKSEMLQNIFELGLTPVREVMVPAVDIVTVNLTTTVEDALQIFVTRPFTRLPAYIDRPDNITGMIHLKDVLIVATHKTQQSLADIVRPVAFVPETMRINELLKQFRHKHMHMAMVLNEHGSMVGLVTLEDILEEIVGEISDEHEDATAQKITRLKDGSLLVDAAIALNELAQHLGITFEQDHVFTLRGFLADQLQHVPQQSEEFVYKNHLFIVHKASPHRVLQVIIRS